MKIDYKINQPILLEQFIQLLKASSLGERRPVDDIQCLKGMLSNSNLVVSAWEGEQLIGIARSMTDFHYACYLSDLAVAQSHQGLGVGKRLQALTQNALGSKCKLIVIASPSAKHYYEKIGFSHNERCWILSAGDSINE